VILYNTAVRAYDLLVNIASPFNRRAKLLAEGRAAWKEQLKKLPARGERAWFHCASLGEFEQARPLIDHISKNEPGTRIIVSFFSPSGYEIRKHYPAASVVFYLPCDTPANARYLIDHVNPSAIYFVKYEIWYHFLNEAVSRHIPTYLVSSTFRPGQYFFRWYGKSFRHLLASLTQIFTQDAQSADLLRHNGITNVTVAGDTRYDRVLENSLHPQRLDKIERFRSDSFLLVAGSSYEAEEELLQQVMIDFPSLRVAIAPHHITSPRVESILNRFKDYNACRYSAYNGDNCRVLVMDNMGLLSSVYAYASAAFVGGAFGGGLHNILEPAVFGIPVSHGPHTERFPEADLLRREGQGTTIRSSSDLAAWLREAMTPSTRERIRTVATRFFAKQSGATRIIIGQTRG
jgi:3-deoxy-D-manno-octulosonic-acid transferase